MFYVCDKRNGKYGVLDTDDAICEYYTKSELLRISKEVQIQGVRGDQIQVFSSDFIKARAKVLGLIIKNTNWIKKEVLYRIYLRSDSKDVLLIEHETGDNLLTKKDCSFFVKDLKIVNLVNNKYFSRDLIPSGDLMVVLADSLYDIEGFVSVFNSYIHYEYSKYKRGYIEELYRLNAGTIVASYFSKDAPNVGYGCVRFFKIRLRDGLVKCVKLKDEYEFSDYKTYDRLDIVV